MTVRYSILAHSIHILCVGCTSVGLHAVPKVKAVNDKYSHYCVLSTFLDTWIIVSIFKSQYVF